MIEGDRNNNTMEKEPQLMNSASDMYNNTNPLVTSRISQGLNVSLSNVRSYHMTSDYYALKADDTNYIKANGNNLDLSDALEEEMKNGNNANNMNESNDLFMLVNDADDCREIR